MTQEIGNYAVTMLWLVGLFVPYAAFVIGNSFQKRGIVILRAILAVGIGWLYIIAYAISANAIVRLSTEKGDLSLLYDGDGAALSFAAVFGWLVPFIIVMLAWRVHHYILRRRKNKESVASEKGIA